MFSRFDSSHSSRGELHLCIAQSSAVSVEPFRSFSTPLSLLMAALLPQFQLPETTREADNSCNKSKLLPHCLSICLSVASTNGTHIKCIKLMVLSASHRNGDLFRLSTIESQQSTDKPAYLYTTQLFRFSRSVSVLS